MKKINTILIVLIITAVSCLCFFGCKSKTVFVPVESVKTEYLDRMQRDSIHLYDSVFVDRFLKNDTVFLTKEKYKYMYRDKLVRDSVFITDSIAVPYPVKGDTEYINQLTWWQQARVYAGNLFIALFIGLLAYLLIFKFRR